MCNYDFVFDLDQTIIRSAEVVAKLYNHDYKTNMEIDYNILTWDFLPYATTEQETRIYLDYFQDPRFYHDEFLVVYEDIVDVINDLIEQGYRVAICSVHHPKRISNTLKWVSKAMPKADVIFVDNFHEKGEKIGKCGIFFDDRIDSLEGMKSHADCLVCVGDFNWNKDWIGLRQSPYNWKELREIFLA